MDHSRLLDTLLEADPGEVEFLLHFLRRPLDRWADIGARIGVSGVTVWRHVRACPSPEVRSMLALRRRHLRGGRPSAPRGSSPPPPGAHEVESAGSIDLRKTE